MEITKREILFSTLIVSIMVGIGIWISTPIISRVTRSALETASSVAVSDPEKFGYIRRTDAGRFLAEGTLYSNDTITLPELPGQYSKVEKVKERYTLHTEIYTTTDSKGHVHTHTRTYYSWDRIGSEEYETEDFTFLGEVFTGKEIHYRISTRQDTIIKEKHFWKDDIRYVYYTAPLNTYGVLSGTAQNREWKDLSFSKGTTIEKIIGASERDIKSAPIVFWILWTLLIALVVFLFYRGEYEILEK